MHVLVCPASDIILPSHDHEPWEPLASGVPVEAKTRNGFTPLMNAVNSEVVESVRLLLTAGTLSQARGTYHGTYPETVLHASICLKIGTYEDFSWDCLQEQM